MSMVKAFTCPSKREARAFPLPETVELFVPVVVNANEPVGFGGFKTSRASRRMSAPNLIVWRPRTIVNVSRNSVIDVVKLELAAVVGPICWNPARSEERRVGKECGDRWEHGHCRKKR